MQWLLSSSLLLGAYLLGRRAQQDRRLVPAAIILFLFAIPIPIVASLFPGPDQLREFTSIKYGPPIAAFVEAGEKAFQQSPFKPLGNASEGAAAYAELHLGVKPEGEGGSPGSESNGDQELGFHSQPEALNDSSDLGFKDRSELPNPGQMVSTEAVERNASGSQPKSGGSSLAGTAEVNGRQAENVAISNSVTVMETTRSQALNHTRPQTPEDQVRCRIVFTSTLQCCASFDPCFVREHVCHNYVVDIHRMFWLQHTGLAFCHLLLLNAPPP